MISTDTGYFEIFGTEPSTEIGLVTMGVDKRSVLFPKASRLKQAKGSDPKDGASESWQ